MTDRGLDEGEEWHPLGYIRYQNDGLLLLTWRGGDLYKISTANLYQPDERSFGLYFYI
jgi:hypothetical protein